jgi:peptide-methionine (S)-S-oxide reductase
MLRNLAFRVWIYSISPGEVVPHQNSSVSLCFYPINSLFVQTTVGYTQGHTVNPTYEDVCGKKTGHAEAVLVEYDPSVVTYEKLLEAFWKKHDPTQKNRQGPDFGSQYRSGIYFHTPAQERAALSSMAQQQKRYLLPIATEVLPATTFYPAEEYHQQYLFKGGVCNRRSACMGN